MDVSTAKLLNPPEIKRQKEIRYAMSNITGEGDREDVKAIKNEKFYSNL